MLHTPASLGSRAGAATVVLVVVAIIAGVLVALFIYRQITLGRLREARGSEFKL